jgi:glutathione S-transferase
LAKPILYVFTISHYCEKARWALDACGIDYVLKPLAPGLHARMAKKLGVDGRSVPFLKTGDGVIHGSSSIVDWAEKTSGKSLTPADAEAGRAIETRLDDTLGVHIRRYFYSEAILHHPETVQRVFARGVGAAGKLLVSTQWSKICGMMIKGMDLGDAQGKESLGILEREMDWLDGLLAGTGGFLVGDRFSRVDLTAASLLGSAVNAPTHPASEWVELPPNVSKDVLDWAKRPSFQHAKRMYAEHR